MDATGNTIVAWALSTVGAVLLMVLSLHLRANRVSQSLAEIRTMLLGFGQGAGGGLLHRLNRLELKEETVDDRINTSRQLAINQFQASLTEVEERILARIDVSDQRVQREIDELKERRRP